MPDQKHFPTVTYDRKKIREKIVPFTFIEARRVKENIYDALCKELFEDGCRRSAKHLMCLAEKERALYAQKIIRDQVCDNRELLMALFENLRICEKAATLKEENGIVTTCKCLYQILLLLEPFPVKLDWLLSDVFGIIARICEDIESLKQSSTTEYIARIYFKYGIFLNLKGEELPKAIKYLEKALVLSRNEAWKSDVITSEEWGLYPTLHLVVGRKLSSVFMKYAKIVANTNAEIAAELAQKAIITLAEVGKEKNKMLFFRACLARADFLVQNENYDLALKAVDKILKDFKIDESPDFTKSSCEVHLIQGICLMNLGDKVTALETLQRALATSRLYKMRRVEAEVLVTIGKLHSKNHFENRHAQETFNLARRIYSELNDMRGRKKVHYLLAKLQADEIFPYFMDIMKDSQEQYCNFYNLRQWKNNCKPFWKTMGADELKREEDEIYCLLEGHIPGEKWNRTSVPPGSESTDENL